MADYIKFFIRTFAVLVGLLSASTAHAQWQGTWDSTYGPLKLEQADRYVFGDYGNWGTIQGVTSPDRKTLRGVYVRNDRKLTGYFEWRLTAAGTFEGRWQPKGRSLPSLDGTTAGTAWQGRITSARPRRLAVYRGPRDMAAFLRAQDRTYTSWVAELNTPATSATRPPPPPPPSSQTAAVRPQAGIEGTYVIKNWVGFAYGPFDNKQTAIGFNPRESSGVVTGGGQGWAFVGRQNTANGNIVRGVWFETAGGRTSGRWGVAEFRFSGSDYGTIEGRFSYGYRRPLPRPRNADLPGTYGTGSKATSNLSAVTRGHRNALSQWRALVAKPSPFPGLHGIWPTPDIDRAIQAWAMRDSADAGFGASQTVDLCSAAGGCMAPDPVRMRAALAQLLDFSKREMSKEFGGMLGLKIAQIKNGNVGSASPSTTFFNRQTASTSIDSVSASNSSNLSKFSVYDENARFCRDFVDRDVLFQSIAIEPTMWSDPTRDLALTVTGSIVEFDPIKNDKHFLSGNKPVSVKDTISSSIAGANSSRRIEMMANQCVEWSVGFAEENVQVGVFGGPDLNLHGVIRVEFEQPR